LACAAAPYALKQSLEWMQKSSDRPVPAAGSYGSVPKRRGAIQWEALLLTVTSELDKVAERHVVSGAGVADVQGQTAAAEASASHELQPDAADADADAADITPSASSAPPKVGPLKRMSNSMPCCEALRRAALAAEKRCAAPLCTARRAALRFA
jgi:hypothetical protein